MQLCMCQLLCLNTQSCLQCEPLTLMTSTAIVDEMSRISCCAHTHKTTSKQQCSRGAALWHMQSAAELHQHSRHSMQLAGGSNPMQKQSYPSMCQGNQLAVHIHSPVMPHCGIYVAAKLGVKPHKLRLLYLLEVTLLNIAAYA
jgi:hypothetical protein